MTWLTYRQHRLEVAVLLAVAIGLAAMVLILVHLATSIRVELGLDHCRLPFQDAACADKTNELIRRTSIFRAFLLSLNMFPALVAVFLGGPFFAREFEHGTHRLAWTQGITRLHWMLSKLGLVALAVVAAGLPLAAVGGQVLNLLPGEGGNLFAAFDFEGPAIISYLICAFAVGAAFGAIIRRTVPSMLAALVTFVGIRVLVESLLRPYYLPPLVQQGFDPVPSDVWSLGTRVLATSGAELSQDAVNRLMAPFNGSDLGAYLTANGVTMQQLYQPAERYWLFQSIEAVIFATLALALVVIAMWLVRRKPA